MTNFRGSAPADPSLKNSGHCKTRDSSIDSFEDYSNAEKSAIPAEQRLWMRLQSRPFCPTGETFHRWMCQTKSIPPESDRSDEMTSIRAGIPHRRLTACSSQSAFCLGDRPGAQILRCSVSTQVINEIRQRCHTTAPATTSLGCRDGRSIGTGRI